MSFHSDLNNLEAQEDVGLPAEGDVSKPRSWSTVWQRSTDTTHRSFSLPSLKRKAVTESMPLDIRLQAMALLFGLGNTHAQHWPGIHVVCSRLEKKFEVLLREDFNVIWKILKQEKPTEALEGWHWCLAVLRGFQTLQADESVSMENIYQHLIKPRSAEFSDSEKDCTLIAIFAVLCWTSMTLDPDLELYQTNKSTGNNRHLSFRAKGVSRADDPSKISLSQTVRRPITKLFRSLRGTFRDFGHVGTAAGATDTDTLHESCVNFFSLYTISRVRVKWVEDLTSHLAFDRQSRTLSVFCLPTFCVSSILRTQEIKVLQQVSSELFPSNYYTDSFDQDNSSLHREVLLSYRLLFGQSSRSRALSLDLVEQLKKSSDDIDPFLPTICSTSTTQSRFLRRFTKPRIPAELLPASNLDLDNIPIESDTYSSRDDFPYFGPRLLALQQYNLRQQPSRVRDLWWDRRNPLQWYTFWAVLWVGGISIVLSIFQLVAAVVQAYYAAPK
ncbi:uncharacterized protein BDZ99DRAFT_569455 [Mytilinidion resinicola]|uniref:Uncharacterized protein n=1 Tax=Mytilinidion resinicola TaxID=574789 RepID=A0A6A6YR57_9PEZI|nr:uncharacterized protein BDZ99DRAFT_569455 [Mytilinidion resinicola]KAF2811392.1 hypothetical protein BDZ99DRAFT_569455 [Mytilinidion resinicola]